MIDKDANARDPPLKRLGVPVFDLRELRKRKGVVHSIEHYPDLAVKEVRVDGLGESALQSLRSSWRRSLRSPTQVSSDTTR